MVIKKYEEEFKISKDAFCKYDMGDIVYFDIETTGFDRNKDVIILISAGRFIDCNRFSITQYFAESLEDESEVLYNFGRDISKCGKWCSYNGIAFDEPFICERMLRSSIGFEPPEYHEDLYRHIRPYYKHLGMKRCNLKTVEKYIGIERKDKIDGGMSVDLYNEYLENGSPELENTILLHNYEDVLNLPKIHEFLYKIENDDSIVRDYSITQKQLKFLTSLVKRNNIELNIRIDKISKKSASRVIDYILKGGRDSSKINEMVSKSY
jgi:hypothetical protein